MTPLASLGEDANLLDVVRNFVAFEKDPHSGRTIRKLPRRLGQASAAQIRDNRLPHAVIEEVLRAGRDKEAARYRALGRAA